MLTRLGFVDWPDFSRDFALWDNFWRQMNRVYGDVRRRGFQADPIRTNLYDAGDDLVVTADVPGMTAEDINVTVQSEVLAISGERQVTAPEGYSVHRQERPTLTFSRSYSLPCPIDPERATAQVKNGVLTVKLAKAAEVRPRQIEVKA